MFPRRHWCLRIFWVDDYSQSTYLPRFFSKIVRPLAVIHHWAGKGKIKNEIKNLENGEEKGRAIRFGFHSTRKKVGRLVLDDARDHGCWTRWTNWVEKGFANLTLTSSHLSSPFEILEYLKWGSLKDNCCFLRLLWGW